jgi:hypothetical protein
VTAPSYRPGRAFGPAGARPDAARALGAFACPDCPCSPLACDTGQCRCGCCCGDAYPLPAAVPAFIVPFLTAAVLLLLGVIR